jgi:UDP-N-acetylmuramate dehydrogenase
LAEILHREVVGVPTNNGAHPEMKIHRESWPVERWEYTYRDSILKRDQGSRLNGVGATSAIPYTGLKIVVLSAVLRLVQSTTQIVQSRIDEFVAYRQRTQPPGASMGSMFKNPPGDYAGRLIEAAGLKGTRIGHAGISPIHANFFINYGMPLQMKCGG